MPRKKSGKKPYGFKRNKSRNLLMFFVVAVSFLSIFVTVNQLQKPQTTTQHASTITTAITKPIWGCIGLGSSDICTSANDGNNFTMDQNSADCLVVKGSVTPEQVEQGQELTFVFDVSVKDTPECKKGFPISQLSVKATHSKSGKVLEVQEKSGPQTLSTNALKFTTKHKVDAKEELGEWTATLYTLGPNNTEVKFPGAPDLKFTVVVPCKGLTVSGINVEKDNYSINETIKGTAKFKNECAGAYSVKDLRINLKRPNANGSITTQIFGKTNGAKTFQPNEEFTLNTDMIVPENPCGTGKTTCTWSIFGAFQKPDDSWIIDTTFRNFNIISSVDPVDADKAISKVPAGATCDPTGKTNKCIDGYVCPQKAGQNGKNVCIKQTPANGICDPKEGNLCVSGYACKADKSSTTGNKCLPDKTAKLPANAWCDPKKGADQCVDGYTCSDKIPATPKPPVGTPGKCIKGTSGTTTKMKKEIVYFDFNSSAVKSDYSADLGRVVTFMKANTSAKVRLEGNTDNVGTETYNKDLGMQRAQAVKNYLVGKGIAANRFEVISNGESKPLTPNKTATDRYRNRRVEIITP